MYRIGQLATLANVSVDTIRFYEKQQMMAHEIRTEGGFRLYSDSDLQRLKFIRFGRQLGFGLDSIRDLLSIRVDPAHHTCEESKAIVEARLSEVNRMIDELQNVQRSLQRLSDACCGEVHASDCCSILEALEQGTEPKPEYSHRRD
ncbi:Zn(2+)-responsive transcriptional regulator [Pantoea latae]|uniref:Zinc-responsive transcriptional regulator n=1 Tax=Pantoea latae TaxID=1964541 RepID=A0A1V9DR03_9GAMM|nr:Zn(2+)-responsive transcriptional regulator [Pantoea latae]OQP36293.1 zinc-responsive transcriptional regulator [Pantoea latae]